MFAGYLAGYVPLASQSPYPIIVYFWANQSLFGKCNFRDLNLVTFYLCISLISVVSRTECNAVNASLLLNSINNNFLIFLTENLPILNPYLPPKSENLRPHYSHSSRENATPSSGTSPLASCKGVPPFGCPTQYHCFRFQPHLQHRQQSSNCDKMSLLLVFTGTETFRSLLSTVIVGILLFM